jgi:hypothetical protein
MRKMVLVLVTGVVINQCAYAFEIATHAAMTYNAFKQSVLVTDEYFLVDIGFPGLDKNIQVYFDGVSNSAPLERNYRFIKEIDIITRTHFINTGLAEFQADGGLKCRAGNFLRMNNGQFWVH